MLTTILVLQIITLVFGLLPIVAAVIWTIYDIERERKQKRAPKRAHIKEILNKNGILEPTDKSACNSCGCRSDDIYEI